MPSILETHEHPKYARLSIQLRRKSRFYQGVTFLDGRKVQTSLKTSQLPAAFKLGEAWYRKLLRASVSEGRKHPYDRLTTDPTIAELFSSYRLTLDTPAKQQYADMKWGPIQHFWRTIVVTDVTAQTFRDFYAWRRKRKTPRKTVIKNHSLHKDMMVIRQVLTYAIEKQHITALPPIPKVGKITANPRPWLTRDQWETLIGVSGQRISDARNNTKLQRQRQDLDDFLFCLLESTMRVSELRGLTVGQVKIMKPKGTDPHALIQASGKTGHRQVVAGGFFPEIFERRAKGRKPADLLWPHSQRDAFRELLIAAGLRTDDFGNTRNLKSIRATAISFRILAQAPNPNLWLIARNAGTSIVMIDAYYAKRLSAEMGAAELTKSLVTG